MNEKRIYAWLMQHSCQAHSPSDQTRETKTAGMLMDVDAHVPTTTSRGEKRLPTVYDQLVTGHESGAQDLHFLCLALDRGDTSDQKAEIAAFGDCFKGVAWLGLGRPHMTDEERPCATISRKYCNIVPFRQSQVTISTCDHVSTRGGDPRRTSAAVVVNRRAGVRPHDYSAGVGRRI